MKLLLDTHTLLWWAYDAPESLVEGMPIIGIDPALGSFGAALIW